MTVTPFKKVLGAQDASIPCVNCIEYSYRSDINQLPDQKIPDMTRVQKNETVNTLLRNNSNSDMGWVVQKFGGTSVGKFAEKIAEDVVSYIPPQFS